MGESFLDLLVLARSSSRLEMDCDRTLDLDADPREDREVDDLEDRDLPKPLCLAGDPVLPLDSLSNCFLCRFL